MPQPEGRASAVRSALASWAWLAVFYVGSLLLLHRAQWLRVWAEWSSPAITAVTLLLILAGEILVTRAIELRAPRPRWSVRVRGRRLPLAALLGAAGRIAVWAALVYLIVELPAVAEGPTEFLRGALLVVWWHCLRIPTMTPWFSVVVIGAWLLVVHVLVVRRRLLRGVLFTAGPAGILVLLVNAFYHGWFPGPSREEVLAQEDVELVFDATRLTDPDERDVWLYTRLMLVEDDDRTIFLSMGRTLGQEHKDTPNLWRIDVPSGAYRTIDARQTRAFVRVGDGGPIVAAPWWTNEAWFIDPERFEIERRIDLRALMGSDVHEGSAALDAAPWALLNMWPTDSGSRLVLRVDPRVLEDVGATDAVAILDVVADGPASPGDMCCGMRWSPDREEVYLIGGLPGRSYLATLDVATMTIGATHFLPDQPREYAVAPATGDAGPALFLSSDLSGHLWRLDLETFASEALCSLPYRARAHYDRFADRLIIVDDLGGTVTRARRDCTPEATWTVGQRPTATAITARGVYVASALGVVRLPH